MANFQMSLVGEGLLKPGAMRAWTRERQRDIYKGTERAMREQGKTIAKAANDQARSALNIRRKNFPNIKSRVYASRPDIPPMLRIYSNVPWLGIHARGGVVTGKNGKVLVPLIRIGFAAFKRAVDVILKTGAGFFKTVNGKTLLFAEYQPEYFRGSIRRFMRPVREASGTGRIKKGADIPIAVLMPQVTIRKRIHAEAIVRREMPALVARIEKEV